MRITRSDIDNMLAQINYHLQNTDRRVYVEGRNGYFAIELRKTEYTSVYKVFSSCNTKRETLKWLEAFYQGMILGAEYVVLGKSEVQ